MKVGALYFFHRFDTDGDIDVQAVKISILLQRFSKAGGGGLKTGGGTD